jgi:spermidine synthase
MTRRAKPRTASPPVEILHHARGARQTLVVEKEGSELRLKILSAESTEWQSRLDLRDPSRFIVPYMQAMMLALLWRPEPARAHVLGLGGGRIPAFLRRLFPHLQIDCTEIDRDVYDLAVRFFSFRPDPRLEVVIGDGREFLASCPPQTRYDVIFVDAFCGIGGAPLRLSSREFFELCRARTTPEGIVAINLMPGDSLEADRLRTIEGSFRTTYLHRGDGTLVAFGSDAERVPLDDLLRRAAALQKRHSCEFSFSTLVRSLGRTAGMTLQPLTDATPAKVVEIPAALLGGVRPEDPCPCGSQRPFARCHALVARLSSNRHTP